MPKIEGEVISFSPATVIFLVAVGLALGGIVGGILALYPWPRSFATCSGTYSGR